MGTIATEEFDLMKDSKYRMYVNAVDKALKSFEYTSEWADLISALGKLNKVLLSYTRYPVIPRGIKISKRLAQCMHHALPSGVHLKALETYDIIFKCMGTNRLSQDLFIYSAGLFPVMGYAAMNVRPDLLNIYENHFVPLGERLIPGLNGFLSGVLLGLEEGSDFFDRTNRLLDNVCAGVGAPIFFSHLWECLANNLAVRLPAILYILSRFDRKLLIENQSHIMGTNVDTMVTAICACVQDSMVLVQRSGLDLLQVGFPMHSTQLSKSDMIRLITASLVTILRRDMSLNRRLYAWLLGNEVNLTLLSSDHPLVKLRKARELTTVKYFEMYSRDLLVQAIKIKLHEATGCKPHDLRPYRLLVSLLDKTEIGPVILDDILYEVFRLLYLCCQKDNKIDKSSELIKSANLLFSSLEPKYLWEYTGIMFSNACQSLTRIDPCEDTSSVVKSVGSGDLSLVEICSLTDFLLDAISFETFTETPSEHLLELFIHIASTLTDNCDMLTSDQASTSLMLFLKILSKVQPTLIPQTDLGYSSLDQTTELPKKATEPGKIVQLNVDTPKISGVKRAQSPKLRTISDTSSVQSDSTIIADNPSIDLHSDTTSGVFDGDSLNSAILMQNCNQKEQQSIYKSCIKQYEKFFVTFVYGVRANIGETKGLTVLMDALKVKSPQATAEDRARNLEELLKTVLNLQKQTFDENYEYEGTDEISPMTILNNKRSAGLEWTKPVMLACRVLVDISTFQAIPLSDSMASLVSSIDIKDLNNDVLPEWLKLIIVCCCWLGNTAPSLQLVTIGTLVDIVALCRSSQLHSKSNESRNGVVSLVLLPLLKPFQLYYIEYHTNVFHVIAHWLWFHLANPLYQVRCVELLYLLQSSLHSSDIVENCIGEELTSRKASEFHKLNAFRKFSLLWHVGRELAANSQNVGDMFYKSMLKTLDNLELGERNAIKVEAEGWLLHSLLRGDISRLIDPLILLLLDPCTSRLSVLHAKVSPTQNNDAHDYSETSLNDPSAKIYAISSVDGNVMYHVADKCKQAPKIAPSRSKRVFAITTLAEQDSSNLFSRYVTVKKCQMMTRYEPSLAEMSESHHKNMSLLQNISVFVNPFSVDPNVTNNNEFDEDYSEEKKESSQYSMDMLNKIKRFKSNVQNTVRRSPKRKPESKHIQKSVQRTGSYSSLDSIKTNPVMNSTTMMSSIDLLHLSSISDTIFARVTDGETYRNNIRTSASATDMNGHFTENETDLVRSYSFCGNEQIKIDTDESTPADEYFDPSKSEETSVVREVLNSVLDAVVDETVVPLNDEEDDDDLTEVSESIKEDISMAPPEYNMDGNVRNIHSHLLLYCGVYDVQRTLYAFCTLTNMLKTNARALLCAAATTSVPVKSQILKLLSRHRKSMFGRGFHGEIDMTGIPYNRGSSMYLELLISICLYYIRSYYPNLGQSKITQEDIAGNRQVQMSSVELLSLICWELSGIVRDSGRGLACYLAELLARCKAQKVALHCLLSSVLENSGPECKATSFTAEILSFNNHDPTDQGSVEGRMNRESEAFQALLLRLLLSLIILEHEVDNSRHRGNNVVNDSYADLAADNVEGTDVRYLSGRPIPLQPMFVTALVAALHPSARMRHSHINWTSLVTSSLPYLGPALVNVVSVTVRQLCANIETLAEVYADNTKNVNLRLPADYAITQLEALTVLCHFCLLDTGQPFNHPLDHNSTANSNTPAQLFNNLVHVFIPSPLLALQDQSSNDETEPQLGARRSLLAILPRIVASVSLLWKALCTGKQSENNVAGCPRLVKGQLLDLLSPIAEHHGNSFLTAFSIVWKERRSRASVLSSTIVPEATEMQQVLVQLLSSIKSMPLDSLIQTIHQVVKQPSLSQAGQQDTQISIEVSVLELFVHYVQLAPGHYLAETWQSLLGLLKEGITLSPPSQFMLLSVLSQFVHRAPAPLADRKDQKDLQDITAKMVESCSQIAGACLEQSSWLRRNVSVREDELSAANSITEKDIEKVGSGSGSNAQYSIPAQNVLAQLLAPLLDITFGNQEKERVCTILTMIMYNVTPYLKNHTNKNMPSFHACSQILASISTYQYTRKAWKKDAMELLLDPTLFQMDDRSIQYWKIIIDNLMSQDTTTFRDFMGRINMNQANTLNLFSNREQECEQRAQLLKRLAFVLLCSEKDQFHKHVPEIQERLVDTLRMPQSGPGIHAQVFLCFRVLLLRMSGHHITSMWPIIVSEMVQVMIHIEHNLSADSEEFRRNTSSEEINMADTTLKSNSSSRRRKKWNHRNKYTLQPEKQSSSNSRKSTVIENSHIRLLSGLDWTWVVNSNNGLNASSNPQWLQLQLAAVKLLSVAIQLPADILPQFQMYKWAFVGRPELSQNEQNPVEFVPHVLRIAKIMDSKYGSPIEAYPDTLLPTGSTARSLQDLHPFFSALSTGEPHPSLDSSISQLEQELELDFLEPIPSR
ncbi:protein dopey-1 homolog isoform X1 [Acyrthosiphon pisum]|uniref:Dopey N-terminal domain-containing protein n=1 Tax=Acyrthosiphon pisum TaxID=7029 RepID=A0A8R2FD58_ACYPI|nr:protein dopey-1 homolog isoform X1 [Acyrthosiphon pisum]|eukprot:XP_008187338.1 PREDICTED: protein dopey-1 homolog isoform X1 [Acyrthosiphon pisum]